MRAWVGSRFVIVPGTVVPGAEGFSPRRAEGAAHECHG